MLDEGFKLPELLGFEGIGSRSRLFFELGFGFFHSDIIAKDTIGGNIHPQGEYCQMNTLYYGDNLEVMRKYLKDETIDLCYIDPPFNSKRNYNQIYNNIGGEDRAQAQAFVDTWEWDEQANAGFQEILANDKGQFAPQTVDLIKGLHPVLKKGSLFAYLISMTLRITEIHRILKPTGSFYLHCDPTASHYLKIVLDAIFVAIWSTLAAHPRLAAFQH